MINIWIGIDDTDSTKGGCTTFLACILINTLTGVGYDVIGFPRLVRLNPNIPWKTRGNGAISFQVGKGKGKKTKIGEIHGKKIFCYSQIQSKKFDYNNIKKIIEKTIDKHAKLKDKNTNSGFVMLKDQPSFKTYKKTVQEIVTLEETKKFLQLKKAEFKGYKNCRGLIGATASVAWNPPSDKTYEFIAYRKKERWGSKRLVDDSSTMKMDKKITSTFDNYDYGNNHNRLVPNSPCPVLYGIRGGKNNDLIDASLMIISEKIDSWLIFETNQGTDDHLQKREIKDVKAYQSIIAKGLVCKNPEDIRGGHVIFSISDSTGSIDCAAYEPTKQFRNIIRELTVGDRVEVYGGVRDTPLTVNLEKINIINLKKLISKVENPICPNCGKHMKSKGKNQGFKCVKCGIKSDKPKMVELKREIKTGFYEAPICARRHLSKPLKRILDNNLK